MNSNPTNREKVTRRLSRGPSQSSGKSARTSRRVELGNEPATFERVAELIVQDADPQAPRRQGRRRRSPSGAHSSQDSSSRRALSRVRRRSDFYRELDTGLSRPDGGSEDSRCYSASKRNLGRRVARANRMIRARSMSAALMASARRIVLPQMHPGQMKAFWALGPHRFKALRCGRRFGKREFAKIWIGHHRQNLALCIGLGCRANRGGAAGNLAASGVCLP
jgi:hypothetical protein